MIRSKPHHKNMEASAKLVFFGIEGMPGMRITILLFFVIP
jgi:hypothetical protein